MPDEHVDVLIVGAGLSGIDAGYHLQRRCRGKRYLILEARDAIGGTWDLFRYPGVRSDSDMYTLGYGFRPWTQAHAIADGPAILQYVRETAAENGIDRHIRFGHRVTRASWSSADGRWTVEALRMSDGHTVRLTCGFLFACSGYYDHAAGYTPPFEGAECFQGRIVHPQQWGDDVAYAGRRVIVIGSGATAVTLVPEMAKHAEHVTMLQRSPTYVVARPSRDRWAAALRRLLPAGLAFRLMRWRNVLLGMYFYGLARREPERVKRYLVAAVRAELGPGFDVDTHFTPRYRPWDQRLCLAPDGDLFESLRGGRASVVTGEIDRFTERGIRLRSGEELLADMVVTATGLKLVPLGGIALTVDGEAIDLSKCLTYKGMMYSDVPNLAQTLGYTHASWTLKADLTCAYVCRLLRYMDRHGWRQCTPRNFDPSIQAQPSLSFTSGYVQRELGVLPKQGSKAPWRLHQNYALDLLALRLGRMDDGVLEFSGAR